MQRFFFNLHECGTVTIDEEGTSFADAADAREFAVAQARAIMCAEVQEGRLCMRCNIEVLEEDGRLAADVPFTEALLVRGL